MKFPFICFDTEDNSAELMRDGKSGFDKQVTQIAAMTGDKKKTFYNQGDTFEFLAWILRRKEQVIYCHNLQYDLGSLFGKELDSMDVVLVGGRMIQARWKGKVFYDSLNIWPMAAKKLGHAFGIEKLETTSMASDRGYVLRDVEIIVEAMRFAWSFCAKFGIEKCPATLGGLCVKLWKALGGDNCHDSTHLSREGYYGGRVELFKKESEGKKVYYTDLNSLYPFAMTFEYPETLEATGKQLKKFGVADVTVDVPERDLTVLPCRDAEARVLYGYGKMRGVWTIAEIRAAEERGAKIVEVHECYSTDESFKPYEDFVRTIYRRRTKSKSDAEKLFLKLVMNNLYGRLGTGGVISRTVWQTPFNFDQGMPYGEKILIDYELPLPHETNWIHAAYVTAYGRLILLEHLEMIGAENLIYCDTDSAIFDWPENSPLPFETGGELGQMKIEGRCSICNEGWHTEPQCENAVNLDHWSKVVTYAPKMYVADKAHKAKGVPKKFQREYIEKKRVTFAMPYKFREAAAFFDRENTKELAVWHNITKDNLANYDKKELRGNRFFPCQIKQG